MTTQLPTVTVSGYREEPPGTNQLFGRRVSLFLLPNPVLNNPSAFSAGPAGDPLDLSALHITFHSAQSDEEGPNSCAIRVHNLAPELVARIKKEYGRVVLQAGYDGAFFGVIFDGTIRQWKEGRESNRVDTYLDILAADGDLGYNYATISQNVGANSTQPQRLQVVTGAFAPMGLKPGDTSTLQTTGGTLPRGRVFFGLARAAMRSQVVNYGATWNIERGAINVTRLRGYTPQQAVVLNAMTGLIGRAEQTMDGIKCRCLINPRISVGTLVQIDNASVNQVTQQQDHAIPGTQLAYNKWAQLQFLADVTADGLYRVYVCEFIGDNRGPAWYQELILLAVDPNTKQVKGNG